MPVIAVPQGAVAGARPRNRRGATVVAAGVLALLLLVAAGISAGSEGWSSPGGRTGT